MYSLQEDLQLCAYFCFGAILSVRSAPTEKRPLGRPRRRWENNITIYLKEIGINTRNWVDLAQNRDYWRALVNTALNLRVP